MNRALGTWSPRTHPLVYDSLLTDGYLPDTPPGNTVGSTLPFSEVLILPPDSNPDSIFNRSSQISYAIGPRTTGDIIPIPMPWSTTWAAWVSSVGVRYGRYADITLPANDLGSAAPFYDAFKPTKLSLGFSATSRPAIAVQKTPTEIEVRWYRLNPPAGQLTGLVLFQGVSPVLFNNGLVSNSGSDLALYYLKADEQTGNFTTIFARFERELFATEHVINPQLQVDLSELITAEPAGDRLVLYATDSVGQNVSFYGAQYVNRVNVDAARLTLSILAISYDLVGADAGVNADAARLALALIYASYAAPVVAPVSPLSGDANSLNLSLLSAAYS